MKSNKESPLVPGGAAGAPRDHDVARVGNDFGAESENGQEPREHDTSARLAKPPVRVATLWKNGYWSVTEEGLQSDYVINGVEVGGMVHKHDLLRVRRGAASVSNGGLHFAEKSWLHDPEPLIEALAKAIDLHHPTQKAVDLNATAEEVRRTWRRSRPLSDSRTASAEDLGLDYVPGEATLKALERRAKEAKDDQPSPPIVADPSWIVPYIARVRAALIAHGVDPSIHSGGLRVNEGLAQLAVVGATEEELASAAMRLMDEHIDVDQETEDDIPVEAEWEIEELIRENLEKRHG